MSSPCVVWVDELDADSIPLAGSKIARLGELRVAGVKVPEGFAVTTSAYLHFVEESGVAGAIERFLGSIDDPESFDQVELASEQIRRAFDAAPMPPDIGDVIGSAYEELSERCRDLSIPAAVRSSATGEDSSDASFAGQFDTYLGVTGSQNIVGAVQRCWGSLFTGRALSYRLRNGLSYVDSPMAVGVIELVHARSSGVAFSIHPVSGKRDRLVIEGSWGWGEAVVQGLVTPDHIEVGKVDRRVLTYEVADKQIVSAFDYSQGRVVESPMPKRLCTAPILDDEQIGAIVDAVLDIEEHYGYAVDVEWVLDRHRRQGEPITIVQVRPETVHSTQEERQAPTWDVATYAQRYLFGGDRREGSGGR